MRAKRCGCGSSRGWGCRAGAWPKGLPPFCVATRGVPLGRRRRGARGVRIRGSGRGLRDAGHIDAEFRALTTPGFPDRPSNGGRRQEHRKGVTWKDPRSVAVFCGCPSMRRWQWGRRSWRFGGGGGKSGSEAGCEGARPC
ncbi:unnamed protein product, partial [Scytosiphon promiscuus]